uniref:Uncharacterized protein n=1 Tax=Proboscia inermis TaxID=420281 RepID=A0A7S0BYE2_9STRA|mmetsp:Transcript_14763/g.14949  ORF Transcript_14763/g.14949 Transcript_14763/m.14949 type:complete len:120 (+) Transcript_14763:97-456(+)
MSSKAIKEESKRHKPGQKFPTPTPGFADRVFYETLLRQRPGSMMAQEWCVNFGVLPRKESSKLYKKIMERKGMKRSAPSVSSSSVVRKKKKSKSNIIRDDGVDVGMQVRGDEAMGSAVM